MLFYAFPVLVPSIARDTGWSPAALTAALSAALLVSAVTGIAVGRVLDRRGPRLVMTAETAAGVGAVVLIATARTLPGFFAGWIGAGLAMAATFYPPAFAALTRWYGPRRVRALTTLTLAAGFASTVFAPLTALLAGTLGRGPPTSCSPSSPCRATGSGSAARGRRPPAPSCSRRRAAMHAARRSSRWSPRSASPRSVPTPSSSTS